jgi:hypothetical protein
MGFLCKTIENKYLDDPLNRDLALSNIYNVNSDTNFCFESFSGPSYYLSGATKATTGSTGNICVYSNWEITLSSPCTFDLYDCNGDVYDTVSYTGAGVYNVCSVEEPNTTIPCLGVLVTNVGICSTEFTVCSGTPTNCYAVYNLSEVDDFQLDFNFTGSTDYTGYTGQFCYRLYNRLNFKLGLPNKDLTTENPAYINCIDFSAITSSTLSQTISVGDIPKTNTDYLLRSYYRFNPKKCSTDTIDTWLSSTQLNNFNITSNSDWYFITINNPPTPVITTTFTNVFERVTMVQEIVNVGNSQNFFLLKNQPLDNKINVYVNGIRLTEGLDYFLDVSQFPRTNPILNFVSGQIESRDTLTLVYLVGPQSFLTSMGQSRNDLFEIDTFTVTGFTTNVTASTVNIVNNNTIKSTQEVFLTHDFDPASNIVAVVNGVTLTEDVDFYRSTTTPNKIILNPTTVINLNDILSFWYFKTTLDDRSNLGTLQENKVKIQWKVDPLPQQNFNTGKFVLEVTNKTDINWTSLFYTKTIDYINGSNLYEDLVQNLTANIDYKFRIIFYKTYKNILNEDIISSSSTIGYFNTKNDRITYRY